ncbi:MAG TPA: endonuclease domain-containing protein [Xanthobacteraceae bacterium]|nr:endonuclease domain-containing protein [Xanthobacteraceae bacterium]
MDGRVWRARRLRRDQTDAEQRLWAYLRNRQLGGWKFRRQVPVGCYVVDFLCPDAKLAVELDGGQHSTETDAERTRIIEADGYLVIRFWNNEVNENIEGVLARIIETLRASTPHPTPLPDGERE